MNPTDFVNIFVTPVAKTESAQCTLGQVSLNKKIWRATIHETHPHIRSIFIQAHTALQLLWTQLFLRCLDAQCRCWCYQYRFFWKSLESSQAWDVKWHLLCLLVEAAKEENCILSTEKFALALLGWNFSVSFVKEREIKINRSHVNETQRWFWLESQNPRSRKTYWINSVSHSM